MPYAPRATLDNPYGPQITFRTEDVLPPSAFYISPEDQVSVWVLTDVLAQTIFLQLRLLMPTGIVQLIPYQFSPQATNTWTPQFELPPWEGYLIGALCWSQNPLRGQCFVSVQVLRSAPPGQMQAGLVLLQGYVNSLNVLSYPTSPLESTFSGRGALLTLTQANTSAATFRFTAPAFTEWRLRSLMFQFQTSAVAGSRQVYVSLFDANNVQLGFWSADVLQAASEGVFYGFSPGGTSINQPPLVSIAGPTELVIPAGSYVLISNVYPQAGDTWTQIAAQVEEWMGA